MTLKDRFVHRERPVRKWPRLQLVLPQAEVLWSYNKKKTTLLIRCADSFKFVRENMGKYILTPIPSPAAPVLLEFICAKLQLQSGRIQWLRSFQAKPAHKKGTTKIVNEWKKNLINIKKYSIAPTRFYSSHLLFFLCTSTVNTELGCRICCLVSPSHANVVFRSVF